MCRMYHSIISILCDKIPLWILHYDWILISFSSLEFECNFQYMYYTLNIVLLLNSQQGYLYVWLLSDVKWKHCTSTQMCCTTNISKWNKANELIITFYWFLICWYLCYNPIMKSQFIWLTSGFMLNIHEHTQH